MLFMGALGQRWFGVRGLVFTHPFVDSKLGARRSIPWSYMRRVRPAWATRVRVEGTDQWSVCRPC